MKKGFTLIELLVVIAIIAVLIALIVPFFFRSGFSTYSIKENPVGKVLRKYEVRVQDHVQFRVDFKRENGHIDTVIVQNDTYLSRWDADTVYANIEVDKWYQFSTVGKRDEYWQMFPNVIIANNIPAKDQ